VILAVALLGSGASLGEVSMVAYCDSYDPVYEQMYNSGTRGSGVISSMLYLGLTLLGLSNRGIFMVILPLPLIYYMTFVKVNSQLSNEKGHKKSDDIKHESDEHNEEDEKLKKQTKY